MKSVPAFLLVLMLHIAAFAQRTVPVKSLRTRPQVHVLFEGYSVSFTIKDINKALSLLAGTGDTTYGLSCRLDTVGDYYLELYSGNTEYHSFLQPLLQNGIGVFLLSQGHAYIEDPKHKKIKAMTMNILPPVGDEQEVYVLFYDPGTGDRIFSGRMSTAMYNKDLGID